LLPAETVAWLRLPPFLTCKVTGESQDLLFNWLSLRSSSYERHYILDALIMLRTTVHMRIDIWQCNRWFLNDGVHVACLIAHLGLNLGLSLLCFTWWCNLHITVHMLSRW
jgi:hypothetical protein